MSDGQTIQLINFSRELRNIWRRMSIDERKAVVMSRPNTEAEIKAAMDAVRKQRAVSSEQ